MVDLLNCIDVFMSKPILLYISKLATIIAFTILLVIIIIVIITTMIEMIILNFQVILLQCIEQVKSNGGVNTLVDGFNIIEHFKQEQPKYYELMVSTPVVWQVIGRENIYGDFKMTFPRPVIE